MPRNNGCDVTDKLIYELRSLCPLTLKTLGGLFCPAEAVTVFDFKKRNNATQLNYVLLVLLSG